MNYKLLMIFLLVTIEGCTSVNIYTDGNVSTTWYFGVPVIKVEAKEHSTVVKTKSMGIVNSPYVFNIGYLNETYMVSGKACELVLFEPNMENLSELKELINTNRTICTTNKEN